MFRPNLTKEEKITLVKGLIYTVNETNNNFKEYDVEKNIYTTGLAYLPSEISKLFEYLIFVRTFNPCCTSFDPELDAERYDLMIAEAKTEDENKLNLTYMNELVEKSTSNNLENYCTNHNDNTERVIVRATEILANRHADELNSIINQIVNEFTEAENNTEE